jgi:hypothetical protein
MLNDGQQKSALLKVIRDHLDPSHPSWELAYGVVKTWLAESCQHWDSPPAIAAEEHRTFTDRQDMINHWCAAAIASVLVRLLDLKVDHVKLTKKLISLSN